MLKIRLKRVGRKHDPSFRIVVTEKHRGPKSGKYIENLGFYDPRRNIREVKADRVKHWIGVGAQVSDTVHNILISEKVLDGKKKNVLPKKSPVVKEAVSDPKDTGGIDSSTDESIQEEKKQEPKSAPLEPADPQADPASNGVQEPKEAEVSSQGNEGTDSSTEESVKKLQ